MATAELVFGELSGGGGSVKTGDTIKINGTEASATTATSQTFTIDTGLTNITRFVFIAKCTNTSFTPRYRQVITYDADVDNSYYTGGLVTSSSTLGGMGQVGSGSYPAGSSNNSFKIDSISGGTVTITTTTVANYAPCDNIHWYAE